MVNNGLTGTIPSLIGNLKNLQAMYLSENAFTGTLPTEIETLSLLDVFELDDNRFEGPLVLPRSEPFLSELYVGKNNFTGEFPDLSGYSDLRYL